MYPFSFWGVGCRVKEGDQKTSSNSLLKEIDVEETAEKTKVDEFSKRLNLRGILPKRYRLIEV